MPRRGGRVIVLERLRWETLLLWLLHVVEETFGVADTAVTERALPFELAGSPHGVTTLELLNLRDDGRRATVLHAPEQEHRVHPLARLATVTVAAEVGHPDEDRAARRLQRDVAPALILEEVARPLSQGTGPAPVLRVVEGGLRRLGHQ